MTSARILADSISEDGHRITTFEATMHRFVLAEWNTHWVLAGDNPDDTTSTTVQAGEARNSASSRAIPAKKMLERARDPKFPLSWPAEKPGMQGGEELTAEEIAECKEWWKDAADDMCIVAENLQRIGLHKSVTNRLLEPFLPHTVISTATAWSNFFELRANPLAQPEIRAVAELMRDAYLKSEPKVLQPDEWHLPLINEAELFELPDQATACKVSAARVARVSALTHDGKRDFDKDLDLYAKLTSAWPMHASPLEHVATPAEFNAHSVTVTSTAGRELKLTLPKYGKFLGWHALRYDVEIDARYQAFS